MVLLKDIKGQHNAVRYLSGCLLSDRIANGYLFLGPEGVGRGLTAKAFIMAMMCSVEKKAEEACGTCPSCTRVSALNHPDVMWIKPGRNKKIKIDEVRAARDMLNMKPYEAPASICVIEDAHMMTVEASNALLKVLEEPPRGSLLILISSKRELLLPTIVSRCTEVRFNRLSCEDTENIITENSDAGKKTAHFLACFCEGSPGRALEMLEEGVLEQRKDLAGMLERVARADQAELLAWDKEGRDALIEDLEILIMFFRDIALEKEGLTDLLLDRYPAGTEAGIFFKKYPINKISAVVEKLIGLKRALLGNVNPKLVAQSLPVILK